MSTGITEMMKIVNSNLEREKKGLYIHLEKNLKKIMKM